MILYLWYYGENDFNKGFTRDDKATGSVQERDTLLGSTETKQVSRCLGGGFGSQTSVDLAKNNAPSRGRKKGRRLADEKENAGLITMTLPLSSLIFYYMIKA